MGRDGSLDPVNMLNVDSQQYEGLVGGSQRVRHRR